MNKYIEDMKRRAKVIAREGDVLHTQALDQIARTQGYSHWGALLKDHQDTEDDTPIPLRQVKMLGDKSIAQTIQDMVDEIHEMVRGGDDGNHIWFDKYRIDIQPADHSAHTRVTADHIKMNMLMLERHLEHETREISLKSLKSKVGTRTRFEAKLNGGLMWSSTKTDDDTVHLFAPRNGISLAPYLPDTSCSWWATHNWAMQCGEHGEYFDPVS